MTLFLWLGFARVQLLDRGCPTGDLPRPFAFGEQLRQETLTFTNALDLEGACFDRLLETREPIQKLSRE